MRAPLIKRVLTFRAQMPNGVMSNLVFFGDSLMQGRVAVSSGRKLVHHCPSARRSNTRHAQLMVCLEKSAIFGEINYAPASITVEF